MADISNNIFDELKKELVSLKIKPVEKVNEADICARFSVTRPPVRLTFQRLADLGLLEVIPYKGTSATLLNLEKIHQIIFLRTSVESWIIKDFIKNKPTEFEMEELYHNIRMQKIHINTDPVDEKEFYRLDSQLHQYWFDKMNCSEIWKMIQEDLSYERFRMLDFVGTQKYADIVSDHEKLVKAISNGDTEAIVPILSSHLNAGLKRMGNLILTDYKQYFVYDEEKNDYWVKYNESLQK